MSHLLILKYVLDTLIFLCMLTLTILCLSWYVVHKSQLPELCQKYQELRWYQDLMEECEAAKKQRKLNKINPCPLKKK
jgi:hypothetical protein